MAILPLLFLGLLLRGQDMHFSQFYATPIRINPAQTGFMASDYRAGIIYKDQWRSFTAPYQTFSGFFDTRLPFGFRGLRFGAGLYALHDQAGDGPLATDKVYGTFSVRYEALPEFAFALGLGGGYVQKKLDYSHLVFDDQWTSNGFDPAASTAEPASQGPLNYMDFSAGLMASWSPDEDRVVYGGLSLQHALRPKESFYSQPNRLGLRTVAHLGAHYRVNETIFLEPGFLMMSQKKSLEWIAGLNAGYVSEFLPVDALLAGTWMRFSGDWVTVVGADYRNARLLISYDVNISGLQQATRSRGGFELSLLYAWNRKAPPVRQLIIPCIRY